MDGSVLALPGETPLHVAAERAYESRCRYIVAQIVAERGNSPARA
jgi:hypothetical protein